MADKAFEAEDPMALTGMAVAMSPADAARAEEEMAACFIEEFVMMGWKAAALLDMFRDPFYRAPNAYFLRHGEHEVRALLTRVTGEEA